LKSYFAEKGIDLSTQDINNTDNSEFIIYDDMPHKNKILLNKKNYLLLLESRVVKPDNWNIEYHKFFKKIFTWDDTLIDDTKYIKINYTHKIPNNISFELLSEKKLCVMVASNKFFDNPNELYSERVKAIQWFECNHPEDFDLYGIGWDLYLFWGKLSLLNRVPGLRKFFAQKFITYKGQTYKGPRNTDIMHKNNILKKYKFCICYENVRDVPGYITEKIFDCFFAGCIPIYWGANNVSDHIPNNTFIDRRKFSSYEELYQYIKAMPDIEYETYLKNIAVFLKGDMILPFSAEYFAKTVVEQILPNLKQME
jgi:hypothetical protein